MMSTNKSPPTNTLDVKQEQSSAARNRTFFRQTLEMISGQDSPYSANENLSPKENPAMFTDFLPLRNMRLNEQRQQFFRKRKKPGMNNFSTWW